MTRSHAKAYGKNRLSVVRGGPGAAAADAAALSLAALPPLPILEEVRVDARVVIGKGLVKLLQQQVCAVVTDA